MIQLANQGGGKLRPDALEGGELADLGGGWILRCCPALDERIAGRFERGDLLEDEIQAGELAPQLGAQLARQRQPGEQGLAIGA